jgi:hypothetical protein
VWSPELRIFAASAFSGSANQITTSPDGITWTSQTTPLPVSDWYRITWSPELRLFLTASRTRTENSVMTSSNGRDWVEQQTPVSPHIAFITNVVGSGSVVTYTALNSFVTGSIVTITHTYISIVDPGLPNPYNLSNVTITSSSPTQFTISNAATGTYLSGGVVNLSVGLTTPLWIPELSMFIIMQRSATSISGSYITSNDGVNWIRRLYITNTLDGYGCAWSPTLKRIVVNHTPNNGFSYMDAIVTHAKTIGENSFAIGNGAQATEFGATAIGANMIADKPNGLCMRHRTVDNTITNNIITQAGFIQGTNELVEFKTPAFHAHTSAVNIASSPSLITFGSVHTNNGGHYNTTTGRFTAPWPGLYKFRLQVLHRRLSGNSTCEITLYKNGVNISSRGLAYNHAFDVSEADTLTADAILQLVTGDTIQPAVWVINFGDVYLMEQLASFTGYYIGS